MDYTVPTLRYQAGGTLTVPTGKHYLIKLAHKANTGTVTYTIGGVAYSTSVGDYPRINSGYITPYRSESVQVVLRPGDTVTNFTQVWYYSLEDDFGYTGTLPAYRTQSVTRSTTGTDTITVPSSETWIIPFVHFNYNMTHTVSVGSIEFRVSGTIHGQASSTYLFYVGYSSGDSSTSYTGSQTILLKQVLQTSDLLNLVVQIIGTDTGSATLKFPYWILESDF